MVLFGAGASGRWIGQEDGTFTKEVSALIKGTPGAPPPLLPREVTWGRESSVEQKAGPPQAQSLLPPLERWGVAVWRLGHSVYGCLHLFPLLKAAASLLSLGISSRDFSGIPVVKNPHTNAGDTVQSLVKKPRASRWLSSSTTANGLHSPEPVPKLRTCPELSEDPVCTAKSTHRQGGRAPQLSAHTAQSGKDWKKRICSSLLLQLHFLTPPFLFEHFELPEIFRCSFNYFIWHVFSTKR